MPIVKIDYEKSHFSREDIQTIVAAMQKLAADATGYSLADISVFASENHITVNAAPIEVYVYATFSDASEKDMELMLVKFKELVVAYKAQNNIAIPFNLSVAKMNWRFKLEV